ncbi:putative Fe-S oxidoreductase [Paraburkholderia caribensis MBA4]|uniref:Putative Fe-S oxidoreductase n=1 Tax=Paraburkholderia caribensis MBA4 TaxID=1323664 RepID=A0A0P0RD48_9BURK|nr:cellulose biosynthesis protein BcsP [Paraburkholderia caribensis]ALL66241.1 putative Fe-S oxidoreductase [Paraburkholderia caribensis MBA4]
MSVSDDVGNLFRRFGGDAGQYQEVTRDDDAKHAALRWPLLNALDIAHTTPVPDAGRPVSRAARVEPAPQASPAPAAQPGATPARPASSESTGPARPPLFARGHRHASMPPPVAPAQMGANRFSAPPSVAAAVDRSHAAANAPGMSAAPAAPTRAAVPPAPTVDAAPSTNPALRDAAPGREAQPVQAAPFFARHQTFARAPFENPPGEHARARPPATSQQQGGSILSGLFGGTHASQPATPANAPSKDLSSLFARLSHGSAAPGRSLRDTFRSRFKADGDA